MSSLTGGRWARVLARGFVVVWLALPATAQYGGGLGTMEQPFLIDTAEQLRVLGSRPEDWGQCFRLTADIDLGERGAPELPVIGTPDDGPFTGLFDGNHKTISHVQQVRTFGSYLGLFGFVEGAQARIENVTLAEPNIITETGRYTGALAGFLRSGTISNCHVRAGSISGENFVGGLVGKNEGGAVQACSAAAVVQGVTRVGGLIGQSYFGNIERCRTTGTVRGVAAPTSWAIGGLVGENNECSVAVSDANCVVEGDASVGGLVGENPLAAVDCCCARGVTVGHDDVGGLIGRSNGGVITDCYALTEVEGDNVVGGLVGRHGPSCYCAVYTPGALARCYAAGLVAGVTSTGGLVGLNERSDVANSFWDVTATGCAQSDGGTGKTTLQMGELATYIEADWDFVGERENGTADLWSLAPGQSYPALAWEPVPDDTDTERHADVPADRPAVKP